MNKLIIAALAATLGFGGVASAQSLATKEASALKKFRANPRDADALVQVALLRERQGKLSQAAATWGLVQKQFKNASSRAQILTVRNDLMTDSYNGLAATYLAHLRDRIRGERRASASQRRAADAAYRKMSKERLIKGMRQVDMDGDGLPELVYYIVSRPDADGPSSVVVDRWGRDKYEHAWMISATEKEGYPGMYEVVGTKYPRIKIKMYDTDSDALYISAVHGQFYSLPY